MIPKPVLAVLIGLGAVILAVLAFLMVQIRDRHPGYSLDRVAGPSHTAAGAPETLLVGFAATSITPAVNADDAPRYWLAGFHTNRPATGVHDPIWARAMVLDDGNLAVGLVVLDAIGLYHDHVVTIRKRLEGSLPALDHLIVSATHNHSVPDLMGLWGPSRFRSGINRDYLELVLTRAVQSVRDAYAIREPSRLRIATVNAGVDALVRDSRKPIVKDAALRLMHFTAPEDGRTVGMLMNWGDHPETLGSENTQITSDFPHFWIRRVEEELGGSAVFANGAIGGLMTTLGVSVKDPDTGAVFEKNSFDKADAQGRALGRAVVEAARDPDVWTPVRNPSIQLAARTFVVPVHNRLLLLAGAMGLLNRGFATLGGLRSEVNLLRIGPAAILTVPGEINPELVYGGIESPAGADFPNAPHELPPLRDVVGAEHLFLVGLGNDEVGYIMPKAHWDVKPPFTYGETDAPYGEIVSLGPDTAAVIHREVSTLVARLRERDTPQ
jgi:hypothetical protein